MGVCVCVCSCKTASTKKEKKPQLQKWFSRSKEIDNYSLKHPFGSELPSLVPWIFQLLKNTPKTLSSSQ
jgi:hypothetical protein